MVGFSCFLMVIGDIFEDFYPSDMDISYRLSNDAEEPIGDYLYFLGISDVLLILFFLEMEVTYFF
jgi:hypothetical protein